MAEKKFEFVADKESLLEGCIFTISIILEVVQQNNKRTVVKFPFYAITNEDKTQQSREWIDRSLYNKEADKILRRVTRDGAEYFIDLKKQVIEESDMLFSRVKMLTPRLRNLSDFDLAQQFVDLMNTYAYYYGLGCPTFIYEDYFSEMLSTSFGRRYPGATDILGGLIEGDHQSFVAASEKALLVIEYEKSKTLRKQLVQKYKENFFYVKTNYALSTVLTDTIVEKMAQATTGQKNERKSREKRYKLTYKEKKIVELLRETAVIRDVRKRTNLIGSYAMFRFLEEVVRRKKIPMKLARKMFWFELVEAIHGPVPLMGKLKGRKGTTVVIDGMNGYYLDYLAMKERKKSVTGNKDLNGIIAVKGKVSGRARIVLFSKDFSKFKKGEVLVASMTRPEFSPVMKLAAAIVTDEGGLTCHAAIIARELHIPCIVGTKVATQVLKDGDLVEVDAEKGFVRILQ